MKPNMILQTDLLDILFHNRNKDYGAYDLRSHYSQRLTKAILITFTLVLLLSVSWYVKANYFSKGENLLPPEVIDVNISKDNTKKEKKEEPKKAASKQNMKQIASPTIVIVPDDKANDSIPENKNLENSQIGLVTTTGNNDSGFVQHPGNVGGDTGTITEPAKPIVEERTEPYNLVQIMPEFPGGSEAFLKFMLRNLKEADDLEEGEKVLVQTRFVVEPGGDIDNIEILGQGSRYDAEVMRVMKKMPQWKPGIQNGTAVPVYFTLPVTFQGKD